MASIKKSVKTKKDLDAMALETGATVTDEDGRKFNARKKVITAGKRLQPRSAMPVPEPEPEAPAPISEAPGMKQLADKISETGLANVKMLELLKQEIAEIKLNAMQPPTEWVFDIVRDSNGYLQQIKATAVVPERTLN